MRRRVVVAAVVGWLALALAPVTATWAEGDQTGGVQAADQGWWSAFSGAGTQPGSPLAGVAPAQKEPAPDVPDGVLPVAMRFGQVDRVSALGITIDAPTGSTVNKLVLHLKESTAQGVQQGTGAAVQACAINDYVQPDTDGASYNTPQDDCQTAHADGVRGDDGTWTFDLTAVAASWQLGSADDRHWIRLDPVGTAPGTFQVGFTGKQDATFEADILAGAGGGNDAFSSPDSSSAFSSSGSYDSSLSSGGSLDTPSSPSPAAPSAPTTSNPSKQTQTTVPVVAKKSGGHTFGDSLLGTALLIVGLAALALAAAWSMGAGAQAGEQLVRRQGGVSRALGTRPKAEELHA